MAIIGGYETHLYCDFPDDDYAHRGCSEFPGPGFKAFYGRSHADTLRQAKQKGWKFSGERCICPMCVVTGRKLPRIKHE